MAVSQGVMVMRDYDDIPSASDRADAVRFNRRITRDGITRKDEPIFYWGCVSAGLAAAAFLVYVGLRR